MTITFENNEADMLFDHQYEQALKDNAAFDAERAEQDLMAAEYRAKGEAARKARVTRELPARKAIAAAVKAPHVATVDEDTGEITIDGYTMGYWLEFSEEHTSVSAWRSRPNGKVRIKTGDFGSRRSFPQRKDGTHNYEEIAAELTRYAVRRSLESAAQDMTRKNQHVAEALRQELKLPEHYGSMKVTPSANRDGCVAVKVELNRTMTPEQARTLHATLKALGLVTERI